MASPERERPYVSLDDTGRDTADEHRDAVELLVRGALARFSGELTRTVQDQARALIPLAASQIMETAYRHPSAALRLMGVAEVAAYLGVSRQRVRELHRKSAAFPEPVAHLTATKVWRAEDIEGFASSWDRRPGRRKKETPT